MSWQSFDALEERIAATRQALAEPLPRRFADPARGERFALLARLVARRGALERAIAAVEERRHRAAVMDEVCREAHAAQWEAVIAAIADPSAHPFYGGLEIPVQRGLVPLGPDPDSGLQEFAHYGSGAVPERDPETGRLQLAADMAIVLVLIPGGFLPDDPISIPPFFLGKYEVTQGQWSALTGANPSRFRAGTTLGDEEFTALHPVEWVNWYECRDVLSAVGLSLPDGRQWELATRAGTVTAWWTGDTEASIEGAGNLWDEAAKRQYPGQTAHRPWDDGLAHTAPVGMFRANPFGLHDVIGNVSEWCRDAHVFDETTESPDPDRDHVRTIRGSSFNAGTTMSRSAVAGYGDAIWRMFRTGVRAARAVER